MTHRPSRVDRAIQERPPYAPLPRPETTGAIPPGAMGLLKGCRPRPRRSGAGAYFITRASCDVRRVKHENGTAWRCRSWLYVLKYIFRPGPDQTAKSSRVAPLESFATSQFGLRPRPVQVSDLLSGFTNFATFVEPRRPTRATG